MKRRQQLSALGLVLALAGSHAGYLFAQGAPAALTVTSTAFNDGDALPKDYSADGKNVSPPLAWTGAPASTKEFAVILDDPDANFGGRGPFVHWVIYKIPGAARGLPEAVPMGANVTVAGIAGAINGLSGFNAFQRPGQPARGGLPRSRAARRHASSLSLHGVRAERAARRERRSRQGGTPESDGRQDRRAGRDCGSLSAVRKF